MSRKKHSPSILTGIKIVRKARGYSQETLSRLVGSIPSSISEYETGKSWPNQKTIKKIADALDVPVFVLFAIGDKSDGCGLWTSQVRGLINEYCLCLKK